MDDEGRNLLKRILAQKKTGRISLQMQPLVLEMVTNNARACKVSINEYICQILIDTVIAGIGKNENTEVGTMGNIDTAERTEKRLLENAKQLDKIRLYTLTELEPILGATHRTLFQYVKDGKLRAVKIGGKWKITGENLQEFIQGRSPKGKADNGE